MQELDTCSEVVGYRNGTRVGVGQYIYVSRCNINRKCFSAYPGTMTYVVIAGDFVYTKGVLTEPHKDIIKVWQLIS